MKLRRLAAERYDSDMKGMLVETRMAEKRGFLETWYTKVVKGRDRKMPKVFWEDYRKTNAGFTDDVINESLLEAYE